MQYKGYRIGKSQFAPQYKYDVHDEQGHYIASVNSKEQAKVEIRAALFVHTNIPF